MQSYTMMHRSLPQRVNPLECALTKNASANLLECALAKSLDLKAPGINTYKKVGGIPPASASGLVEAGSIHPTFLNQHLQKSRGDTPGFDQPARREWKRRQDVSRAAGSA